MTSAYLLPTGRQQYFNPLTGAFLVGGKVFTYAAGTSTPMNTWADGNQVTVNANPVILDAFGSAAIFGVGNYKIVVEDALNNLVFTIDNVSLSGTFIQNGTGAVSRSVQSKLLELLPSPQDFGGTGNGTSDDGPSMVQLFADAKDVHFPPGTYNNASQALVLPFTETAEFDSGASIVNSGSGTTSLLGGAIRKGYNPSAMTSWAVPTTQNYEVLAADLGGYGPRTFSGIGNPSAVSGAVLVPASAIANTQFGSGVSGWAKSLSTAVYGVALYGQADVGVAGTLVWGLNTRSQDNGFATTIWGAEIDVNVTSTGTTAIGCQVVGGSTVQPALSYGFDVNAIGVFQTPRLRWDVGYHTTNGAATVGLSLGALGTVASSAGQPIVCNYQNSANAAAQWLSMSSDANGNCFLVAGDTGKLFAIETPTLGKNIQISGSAVSFFNTAPTQTQVTGFGTPTGATVIANFPGATATLVQTSETVAAILSLLKGLGLIGA